MSRKALIDAVAGESETFFHYDQDGKFAIETRHNDENAKKTIKLLNEADLSRKNDGMRLERVIPSHVLDRSFQEGWFNDKAKWKSWSNSPEGLLYAVEYNGRKNKL